MKKCFKCNTTKPLNQYYKHPKMFDGYLGKCKTCTKQDVNKRYYDPESRKKIIKYERERFLNPERKKKVADYQRKMRINNPGKIRARRKIQNAIRNGTLIKGVCEHCESKDVQAHHIDYRKPLQVRWLCRKHHLIVEGKLPY